MHRRAGLLVEVVVTDEGEVGRERDLAREVDDLGPARDRYVTEPGRGMEGGRGDQLTVSQLYLLVAVPEVTVTELLRARADPSTATWLRRTVRDGERCA